MTTNPDGQPRLSVEEQFGRHVKVVREALGISQEELADYVRSEGYKWHPATVYKVETGDRRVQLGEALAIARYLNSTVESLVGPGFEFFRTGTRGEIEEAEFRLRVALQHADVVRDRHAAAAADVERGRAELAHVAADLAAAELAVRAASEHLVAVGGPSIEQQTYTIYRDDPLDVIASDATDA